MKKVIYTLFLAIFAWLTYMNIFTWAAKVLTVGILVKLATTVLALILSFIVQQLMIKTAGSLILKDQIEEIANMDSIYVKTTKTLLILFIMFCLFKNNNNFLLWIFSSTVILDNFTIYVWLLFVDKMNNNA